MATPDANPRVHEPTTSSRRTESSGLPDPRTEPLLVPIEVGDGGGAAGTSGTVRNVTSRDTILVKGDGSVVDAATISATDGIYGIDFSFTLPKTDWRANIVQVSASNYASYIQQIGGHDHVTAAWYAQDVNAQGLLVDILVVLVESDSGESSTEVAIPFSILNTPGAFARIDDANNRLDQIEAIGA
jgi:hypothetical protein